MNAKTPDVKPSELTPEQQQLITGALHMFMQDLARIVPAIAPHLQEGGQVLVRSRRGMTLQWEFGTTANHLAAAAAAARIIRP